MRVTFTLSLLAVLLAAPSAHAQDASADGALPDLGAGAPCGAITIKGCCDGDILRYCAAGSTKAQRCAPGSCGWDPQSSFYGCGTSGGADPTGVNTRTCPAPQSADAATDGARGDGPRDAAVSDGDGLVAPDAPSPLGDLTIDVRSDRGTTPAADTSPRRDTGTTNSSGTGGCGCRAAAGGGDTLLLGLLVLLLIARRRRLLP